jgi:hypothetical protein
MPTEESERNVYPLPDWQLTDMNENEWSAEYFLGNYTIYIAGDVSRRHGLEDILAWNYVLRQLITNPNSAYPPNVVTVASAMENPYEYDREEISRLLADANELEYTFGVQVTDPGGEFPMMLGKYP